MAVAEATTQEQRRAGLGWRVAAAFLRRREASIFVVAVGLVIFFWAKNPVFVESDNIKNITETMAPIAIVSIGEVMLLICGEIDLAVGRVFALAPAIVWMLSAPDQHNLPLWLGVVVALLFSALVGLVNGVVTTYLRVPSFITTLGMLFFLNGITLNLTDGSQQFMPGGGTFQNIFGSQPEHYALWLNSEFFWALGLMLAVQFVLSWTRWGLHTVATGGNPIGAAESGVNIRRVKIGNFVLANVLAGFAGILDSTRVTTIVPLQGGPDLMFIAVAGAVIGGTSLFGGVGTVVGSFIGVAVITILRTGLNIIGVNAFNFDLIIGIAILVSMIVNVQVARLRNLGKLQ
ncbi:MAG TPA: ABC transporter permease [Gaiellaceae bacterium]|nr:ABC transporter permease [Gaiellaceae bacterium]